MYKQGITIATGIPIYFCDPHSPRQHDNNKDNNGLLTLILSEKH